MSQCFRILVITLVTAATAACGAGAPSEAPSAVSSPTRTPSPTGEATATLTLGPFGNADGPGLSVSEAMANAGVQPLLVNGILLKNADGTVWLCEVLQKSSPPQCAELRLLVKNVDPGDQTLVNGQGLHVADGIRWVEHVQLFGLVRP